MGKIEQYEVADGKLKRKREFCPKCEPGVFLAELDTDKVNFFLKFFFSIKIS